MAASATCTSVTNTGNGWLVQFSDGSGFTFANLEEAKRFAFVIDDDVQWVRMALIAWWLRKNPDGTNVSQLIGKTLTFDLTLAGNPFVFS